MLTWALWCLLWAKQSLVLSWCWSEVLESEVQWCGRVVMKGIPPGASLFPVLLDLLYRWSQLYIDSLMLKICNSIALHLFALSHRYQTLWFIDAFFACFLCVVSSYELSLSQRKKRFICNTLEVPNKPMRQDVICHVFVTSSLIGYDLIMTQT